jgi:hypothetical protein
MLSEACGADIVDVGQSKDEGAARIHDKRCQSADRVDWTAATTVVPGECVAATSPFRIGASGDRLTPIAMALDLNTDGDNTDASSITNVP